MGKEEKKLPHPPALPGAIDIERLAAFLVRGAES